MPYLQPATANYFGFNPVEGQDARARVYLVSSTEANPISIGDVVCYTTDKMSIRRVTGSTTTDLGLMVGVAASRVLAGDGSTAADPRVQTSQTCLVYDDPQTLFYGCDTTSGVLGTGGLGMSVGVCSSGVTGSTGVNTTLGRSVMAISGVTASSGSVLGYRFRVIGMHPIETAAASASLGTAGATTTTRKFILRPDWHANQGSGVGYGHVTT